MLLLLPKIALVVCVSVFLFVLVRIVFLYRKDEVEHLSNLPLEDDKN